MNNEKTKENTHKQSINENFGKKHAFRVDLWILLQIAMLYLIENENFPKRMIIYLIKTFLILLITVNGIQHYVCSRDYKTV